VATAAVYAKPPLRSGRRTCITGLCQLRSPGSAGGRRCQAPNRARGRGRRAGHTRHRGSWDQLRTIALARMYTSNHRSPGPAARDSYVRATMTSPNQASANRHHRPAHVALQNRRSHTLSVIPRVCAAFLRRSLRLMARGESAPRLRARPRGGTLFFHTGTRASSAPHSPLPLPSS
jgi:hypothetical protein